MQIHFVITADTVVYKNIYSKTHHRIFFMNILCHYTKLSEISLAMSRDTTIIIITVKFLKPIRKCTYKLQDIIASIYLVKI